MRNVNLYLLKNNDLAYKNIPGTYIICNTGLILGSRPASERQRYFVMTLLIGWAQT